MRESGGVRGIRRLMATRGRRIRLAALLAPLALLAGAVPARAVDVWNVDCSVPALISAVNQAVAAGSGTINLAPGCTYSFTAPYNTNGAGSTALPVIKGLTAALTINGNGATLERSGAEGTPAFRLIEIGEGAALADPGARPSGQRQDVTINRLTITGGWIPAAGAGSGPGGGGLFAAAKGVTLDKVTLADNAAAGCGGGVYAPYGSFAITDSTVRGNAQTSPVDSRRCQTLLAGGAGLAIGRDSRVTGSTISGNTAAFGGAAISTPSIGPQGELLLANTTIVGNTAPPSSALRDGAVVFSTLVTRLVNVTVVDNSPRAFGSCAADCNSGGIWWVEGSIVEGTCGLFPGQPLWSLGSNVITQCPVLVLGDEPNRGKPEFCDPRPAGCGPDVIGVASTGVGPLQDNGGPTETAAIGPDSPAYQLEPAGNCPAADQRGVPRPQPAGAANCNAGAYETQAVATTLAYTGPTEGEYGAPVTLSAKLTQRDAAVGLGTGAGDGIAGESVTIGFGAESCRASTDASGVASCEVTPTDDPAGSPYQITASYAGGPDGVGTDYYLASSDTSRSFTVNRVRTSLSAHAVIPFGVSATLTRTATGAPLAGQTLTFKAGSSVLCTAQTNSTGTASCSTLAATLAATLHLGYTVSYAGSSIYLPSSASGALIPPVAG